MLYYCFSRVQPVAAWFLQFCWLETHIVADTDSLNLIINWVQLWPVGAYSSGEMKLGVLRSSCWTVLRTSCTGACMSCVAERQIILLSTKRLITANICWDSKIFHQYCPLTFHLRLDKEQLPLLTQRSTSPQTWWTTSVVTDDSMLYSFLRSCLVYTADSRENKGRFSCDQVIIWMWENKVPFDCLLS